MTLLENKSAKRRRVFIMIVYLAGIFMGALDTGIVTPARTLIQNGFGVGSQTGIWMITIYTLAYAASIPIMGKIADKFGRKYIYLISIFLFGFGSLFCGLSQYMGSFSLLLISRVIQAIGGGGIIPIATAEFGTTFPKEKRGIALGLVGGTYGIANIFGASAGSAILDIFGSTNWSYIFFVNVPITVLILIFGIILLPNTKIEIVKKIDFLGIFVLTSIILSLLYGLKSIDFMNFGASILSMNVYLFIIIALALIPIFILIEKKAEDPVLNISYFKNKRIVITLLLSFISGVILMGTIFVPQFSENAMKIVSGSGGYFVILLGVFAGIGAPLSGKLIDKFGVKPVLSFGFITTISAALFLIFVTINYPSIFTVAFALMLIGLGMGFSLGTPLNYMMLENTKATESNSALATLSLVRSIGTSIAPSIMIAFIASAGILVQSNVMATLPTEVVVPPLVYSQDISDAFTTLQEDQDSQLNLKIYLSLI
jgi:EmrB/QacA subfamily drug resistance transporter